MTTYRLVVENLILTEHTVTVPAESTLADACDIAKLHAKKMLGQGHGGPSIDGQTVIRVGDLPAEDE